MALALALAVELELELADWQARPGDCKVPEVGPTSLHLQRQAEVVGQDAWASG